MISVCLYSIRGIQPEVTPFFCNVNKRCHLVIHLPSTGKYIGNVHRLYGQAFVAYVAIEVHKAGMIGRNDAFCTGLPGIGNFLIGHAHGNRFKLNGKGAAKATTGFHIIHLRKLQSFYLCQQGPWFCLYFAFAQGSAGIMVSGFCMQGGAQIFYLQYVHEEVGKFKGSLLQFLLLRCGGKNYQTVLDSNCEQIQRRKRWVLQRIFRPTEIVQKFGAYFFCFPLKPCIECRLAAAGLLCIVRYGAARFLQHFHHIEGCLRVKLINKTRYKKLYVHAPYPLPHFLFPSWGRKKEAYFLNELPNAIILMAVIAASSPLWPCLPPMRSSACCWLSTVSTPKMVGTGRVRLSCNTPWVTPWHTYSKWGYRHAIHSPGL